VGAAIAALFVSPAEALMFLFPYLLYANTAYSPFFLLGGILASLGMRKIR
jgi:hypothetical protein